MDSQKISEILKTQRTKLGLSIPTVVERTKIKRSYIEAMESGDLSIFDNPVYLRNFVRTYARFLKVPEPAVLPLLLDPAAPSSQPVGTMEPPSSQSAPDGESLVDKGKLSTWLLIAAACLVVAGLVLKKKWNSGGQKLPSSVPVEEAMKSGDVSPPLGDQPVVDSSASNPVGGPQEDGVKELRHIAEMQAMSEVWLSWESENDQSKRLMQTGDRQTAPFEQYLRLSVGNPSGLKLILDGVEISLDTGKVYNRMFRVREDGRVVSEALRPPPPRRGLNADDLENNP